MNSNKSFQSPTSFKQSEYYSANLIWNPYGSLNVGAELLQERLCVARIEQLKCVIHGSGSSQVPVKSELTPRTGVRASYEEVTLGLNWHPCKYLDIRPEIRGDFASAPAFGVNGDGTTNVAEIAALTMPGLTCTTYTDTVNGPANLADY